MRELAETDYQFREDFVLDSSAATQAFGLTATPWDQILHDVVAWYLAGSRDSAGTR
jgi:hypothetical protein